MTQEKLSEKATNLIQETSQEARSINAQVEAERERGKAELKADLLQYLNRDRALEIANLLQRVESIEKRGDYVGQLLQDVQTYLEHEYNKQIELRKMLTNQIDTLTNQINNI